MDETIQKQQTAESAPRVVENSSHKKLLWILVLGALGVLCGYGALFYFIQVKISHVSSITTTLEEQAKKGKELEVIQGTIERTKDLQANLDDSFVFSNDIVSTIEKIESLGVHAGVELVFDSVNIKKGATPALLMQIRAGGSFESLFYLLSLIESLPLKLSLERISIDKKQPDVVRPDALAGSWMGLFTISVESFLDEERVLK